MFDDVPAGSWAALTGLPELGLTAAAELGVVLDWVALVPSPMLVAAAPGAMM